MIVVLEADQDLSLLLVAVTVITATSLGALIGGFLTTRLLGSYTNPKTIFLCLFLYLILTLAALPLSFLPSSLKYLFIGLVWIIMFCHGFMEPILTGILLNSVDAPYRATASSLLIFLVMSLGFLPAPYVYGLLMDVTGAGDEINRSPWGMRGVTSYTLLGVLTLVVASLA